MAPSPPGLPLQPESITLSEEERQNGKWSRENLQRALELMHRDGLLVMNGIVDKDELIKIRTSMQKTSKEVKKLKTRPTEYNHGIKSNFLQSPPLSTPDLLYPGVYQNPYIIQIAEGYLGSDLAMPFITANTAIASTTERQPVHKDASFVHPLAPFMSIANFLLSDFTPENGSTEFWLGSHSTTLPAEQMWRGPDSLAPTCDIIPSVLEERRQTRPPSQVRVPFGSVLLRDVRTWHAGMPNTTDEDRIMIAVAYQSSWFTRDHVFLAPLAAKKILTSNPKVDPICKFIPDDEWDKVAQMWGQGEPMHLKYGPKEEGWHALGSLKPEEKYINPSPNLFAEG